MVNQMEHITVLKEEAIHYLNINPNGIYVDCTLGGGGHAEAILRLLKKGHLFCFDQDDFAIEKAMERLNKYQGKFTIIKQNFKHIKEALNAHQVDKVDGILYDLGVSSFHFDDPSRGFSYNHNARLDMRMDQNASLTAYEIINTYKEADIRYILFRYAEESFAPKIARKIVESRQLKTIETTFDLVDVIKSALPQKVLSKKGHPAKKTFQALRIAVNDELRVFEDSLGQALQILNDEGRIVVISFHSLEDRIAKQVFKEASTIDHPKEILTMPTDTPDFELLHKKVILPKEEELDVNNRAHSAKLRAIKKINKNIK
ncbi:16S rRNA (cytosine(1402)-N(4))-methyltransferase RsmH [Liberiplasma polymorphum]|uniref:16S rRNA (cytosine(1402)-N(4))-methyltransferase RsmH n=1 Tax=Liberiplasma polymorphum TaxID=3374570 RepID=UPI0037741D0B